MIDVTTIESRTLERIRWGAIVAGLFAALSTLIVLSVLGVAIGLSVFDRGDAGRGWDIGTGIWGAISMIVAFIVGGWLAARWSTPFGSERTGMLHGAMVWAVAIPLSLFVLGSIGAMFGAAAVSDRDTTAARFDGDARPAGARLGEAVGAQTAGDADPTVTARRTATGAAWGTLISLLLGLGAATLGGYLGAARTGDTTWPGHRARTTTESPTTG